ncbi:hypothetical protein [Bradyrhizobium diazoefficiens]|uniref:hypothetical protein n=1 Tax=Bradyrhizobium diazoefficiens TaxID=1355477 RepID=UPI00272AB33F|nr:hypothetical protein [Bradyrhizobium diazoefficiens]WLA64699.1 hypothetical protein QNN01_41655 [Bradyrhizobium diazoefficiens]
MAQDDLLIVPHEFIASERGGVLPKSIKEMGTPEFAAILAAACAAYGGDCSSSAAQLAAAARYATPYVSTGNVRTTAWIDRHPGEEYYAKFAAPDGYTTCKAKIDIGNGSITGGSTFNGSIQRMSGANADGIGLYAVVPKNRPSGQWVAFRVFVSFVPKSADVASRCWPNNAVVFQCTGQNCNTYSGARM